MNSDKVKVPMTEEWTMEAAMRTAGGRNLKIRGGGLGRRRCSGDQQKEIGEGRGGSSMWIVARELELVQAKFS